MKLTIYRPLFLIGLLGLLGLDSSVASPDSAGFVPADWYTLPEEDSAGLIAAAPFGQPDAKLGQSLRRIFSAQHDALSEVKSPAIDLAVPADRPADWVPWRFVSFASDLSVSASGLLGVLSFKGSPSLSVYWQKREAFTQREPSAFSDNVSDLPVFYLDSAATQQQAERQVDEIYKTVLASGHVRGGGTLRSNLKGAVANFREVVHALSVAPAGAHWFASRLRVDLDISASGKVSYGSVGGALRVRLEWFHVQSDRERDPSPTSATTPMQSSILELVKAMTEDLSSAASTPPIGFRATGFNVGLGFGASGNIGVVKGSAQATCILYFSQANGKRRKPRAAHSLASSGASWYLIDPNPSAEALRLAGRSGIEMVRSAVAASPEVMFKVDRRQFRKGLEKAFKIGSYFAQIAAEPSGRDWAISTIKPGFAMSVGGSLGLVKLTGSATAQLEFQNQNL